MSTDTFSSHPTAKTQVLGSLEYLELDLYFAAGIFVLNYNIYFQAMLNLMCQNLVLGLQHMVP